MTENEKREAAAFETEWQANAKLQAEYPTSDAYAATRRRETTADGAPGAFIPTGDEKADAWAREWAGSAALKAEYPTSGAYVATMRRK